MKVKEFISECSKKLDGNAKMDFYVVGYGFCEPISINMNADIDDPSNKNRGGVVFELVEELWPRK